MMWFILFFIGVMYKNARRRLGAHYARATRVSEHGRKEKKKDKI
jgi:hypothetical protein